MAPLAVRVQVFGEGKRVPNDRGENDLEASFFESEASDVGPRPEDVETTEKVHRAPGPKLVDTVEATEQLARAPGTGDVKSNPLAPMAAEGTNPTSGALPNAVAAGPDDPTQALPTAPGKKLVRNPAAALMQEASEPKQISRPFEVAPRNATIDDGPARPLSAPLPFAPPREREPDALPPEEAEAFIKRIQVLTKEANAQPGPAAAPLWFEIGWIYESDLNNLREAAGNYQRAHTSDPTFLPVIHAARRLFSHLEKWRMVVILLDEELKIEDAPKAALLLEKGRIFEGKLASADDAMGFYREALEVDAGYAPAVDALTRHLTERSAFAEMATVLERGSETTENDAQRLAWRVEAARLCETQLEDNDRARALLDAARQDSPEDFSTLVALRRLCAQAKDDDSLADVLDALALRSSSDEETARFLLERAQLLAASSRTQEAAECLQRARALTPDDTQLLAEAARLFEVIDDPASLVDVLRAHAIASNDRAEKVALYAEAGTLAEEKLGDSSRAIELYRECIALDPSYSTANNALGRLFARSDNTEELVGLYESQLSVVEGPERISLLFKFAELLSEKVGDTEAAITRLLELLQLSPNYVPALKMVSSLYARAGRFDDLIKMYEAELVGQEDRDHAIFLLEKIGTLCELELGDLDRAIDAYQRMLTFTSGYLPALRSLGRLYAKTQRWQDLVAINSEEAQIIGDQNQIVALFYRNGDILESRLQDSTLR